MNRRQFLTLSSGALAGATTIHARRADAKFQAIAFDGFTLFDPRPIAAALERRFPQQGARIADAWRARLFEHQWLRALSGRYADFLHCAADGLRAVRDQMALTFGDAELEECVALYEQLSGWPDVPAALQQLHRRGIRLVMLSNMSAAMLAGGLARAQVNDLFASVISADRVRTYKPDPRVYALLPQTLRLRRAEILVAPFAAWDAAGAKWAGFPTFWVNRSHAADEHLGVTVDGAGTSLDALLSFALE